MAAAITEDKARGTTMRLLPGEDLSLARLMEQSIENIMSMDDDGMTQRIS